MKGFLLLITAFAWCWPAPLPESELVDKDVETNVTQLEEEIKAKTALLNKLKAKPDSKPDSNKLIDIVRLRSQGKVKRRRRRRANTARIPGATSLMAAGNHKSVGSLEPVVIYAKQFPQGDDPSEDANETEPVLEGIGDWHPDAAEFKDPEDPMEICIPTEKVSEKQCKDKPFLFDRERVWQFSHRETTGDWHPESNCHTWTRCGGKIEFCYYTANATNFYDYSTYTWPKVQKSGFLGDLDSMKRPMFGSAGTFHSSCCDAWTDPLHRDYSQIQGWVLYPLKGLKYTKAPSITMYGNFTHSVPPLVMNRWVQRGNGSLASGVIEWILLYSPTGGNSDAVVLRQGAIEVTPNATLKHTKNPEDDLTVQNVTIPSFDTGHIAFWTKATYLDPDFKDNTTAPSLLSLKDDIKFIVHHKNGTDLTINMESWPQPASWLAEPCGKTVDLPLSALAKQNEAITKAMKVWHQGG